MDGFLAELATAVDRDHIRASGNARASPLDLWPKSKPCIRRHFRPLRAGDTSAREHDRPPVLANPRPGRRWPIWPRRYPIEPAEATELLELWCEQGARSFGRRGRRA